MKIIRVLIVGALSFVGAGLQAGPGGPKGPPLRETGQSLKPAPDFALPGLDGKTVRLSDYKGKVVIVDFWATWCPPCRAEIPGFVKMAADYKGRVAILGVSLDEGREKDVRPFYAKYAMNYPVAFGNDAVVAAYGGIRGIPTTFVITRDQKIALKHVGYADEKFWREEVGKLLRGR